MRFQCSSCEKFLRIKDELAGKRIKCPGCGTVQVAEEVLDPEVIPAPPLKKKLAAGITAKASIKKPPIDDEEDESPPPRKRRPVRDDDDDEPRPRARRRDHDEDDEPRPRKKKKKQTAGSNAMLIWLLAGGGGLLALIAIVVVVIIVMNSGNKSSGGNKNAGGGGDNQAVADDEPRMIKWRAPHKVGQRRKVFGVHTKTTTSPNPEANKGLMLQNVKVEVECEITTLAVDNKGRETQVEILIIRFEDRSGLRSPPLPRNTRLIAKLNGPMIFYQIKNGQPVQADRLTKFLHMTEDENLAGNDPLADTLDAKKPGSTWPIDKQKWAQVLTQSSKGLMKIAPHEISGQYKFVGIVKQGNRDYFDQEVTARFQLGRQDAKIFILKSATIDSNAKARFPADYSTEAIQASTKMVMKAEYELPPGTPQAGQVVAVEATESATEDTTYLDGVNLGGGKKDKGKRK